MNGRKPSSFRPGTPVAWLLAGGYLAFGFGWILFSDRLGAIFFTTPEALTQFQTWKGSGFVLFTTVILFLAVGGQAVPRDRAARAGRRGPGIVFLLSMLVLATGLPMVALLGWSIARESQSAAEGGERLIARVADGTAAEMSLFVSAQSRTAAALALRHDVRLLDPRACAAMQDTIAVLDAVQEVALFDATGKPVCGTHGREAGTPPWLQPLLQSHEPVVGPVERVGGAWAFAVAHPVLDGDGRLRGAIELLHAAASMAVRIDAPLPEGGAVTLMDQHLAVVARSPGHEQYVGRAVQDATRMQSLRSQRTFTGPGPDGVRRLYAPRPIAGTDWIVTAGVPVDSLLTPGRDALLRSLVVALGVLALCIALVLRLARSITQPLLALERTAAAAAGGDFSGRAPQGGPAELASVAVGVNHMLDRLPELQREVREVAERTANLVDRLSRHVPSMIFVYRLPDQGTGSFPYTSHAISQVFELQSEDVRTDARPAFDRIHPADHERVLDTIAGSARDQAPFQLEFRVVLPRRGVRHILALAQAERSEDRTTWYGSMTDVTELHASQQALLLMNETLEHRIAERTAALEAANTALEAFAYSVAHDLRSPLHSIEGFSQGVLHALDLGDPDRARNFVSRVLANTQRMNTLIDGFLALARAGRSDVDDVPVDLQRLVEEVLAELPRPAAARVEVEPLPRVIADAASLRQVWDNLLSNAFKYSSGVDQPLVRVEWALCGDEARFTVTDNGAGFDPDYADRLFQPFSRLHKPHEFEGTGVGLAVVRRIVERHGGRVWAESFPGEGARFGFALPAERVLAPAEAAPA